MKTVSRFDVGELRASVNEDGYLEDTPVVGRVGIQIYRNPDGSERRELRPPEEVFNADSLASFKGKPITLGHPGAVNSRNSRKHQVGTMLDVGRKDGNNVAVPIIIHADEAISQAKSGRAKQLSLGYRLDLEERRGWFNRKTQEVVFRDDEAEKFPDGYISADWEEFDAVQRNIRINHLALVSKARAGDVATLNLDGDEEIALDDDDNQPKGKTMQKIRLDSGLEYDAAPEVVVAYLALKQDAADKQTKLDEANTTISTITAERDTLKADAAEFETKLKQAREDAAVTIKARTELEAKAEKHGIKCDGLDDISVKKAVVAKLKPSIKLDGKDDTYINVAFDMAIESAPMEQQRKIVNQDKAETRDDASELKGSAAARQKYLDRLHGKKEAK
ncbi:DUF2213 domain-containing protein [Hafnia alvei]|uniref:DUF2213 domain-containing protein n=1 Tax=Hafnia alvei ATCC 51873 TaxID=1002364 RepID=G9YA65_HAFAL|nr:DUF2213 domain-containing protein [Hafnia alvei]EHM40195.1 hypothetical protein HMPREF0454_03486 [Hafnia alvei ATCC 51873]QQE45373.1 DUF2213 domain-containing protein [Hafnia alvei]